MKNLFMFLIIGFLGVFGFTISAIASIQTEELFIKGGGSIHVKYPAPGVTCSQNCVSSWDIYGEADLGQTYTAIPDPGWRFKKWSGQINTTANPYTRYSHGGPIHIVAEFETIDYQITATSSTGGSISPSGLITPVSADSSDRVFSITPDLGYKVDEVFVNGVQIGAVPSYTFPSGSITSNQTINVKFKLNTKSLTIIDSGGGGSGNSFPSIGIHTYTDGELVNLIANPATGSDFQWTGDIFLPENTNGTITMDSDKIIVITYNLQNRTINVLSDTSGYTDKNGRNIVDYGETITIAATADPEYSFQRWIGVPAGQEFDNPLSLNVLADMTIEALFEVVPIDVHVTMDTSKFLYIEKPNSLEKIFIDGNFEVGLTEVELGEEIPAIIRLVLPTKGKNGGDLIIETDVLIEVTDINQGVKIIRMKK